MGFPLSFFRLFIIAVASTVAAKSPTSTADADYVIIGGGPAGLVLAEQLSRNPHIHVVLLEAGPDGINSSLINSESPHPSIRPPFRLSLHLRRIVADHDLMLAPASYPLITEFYWNYTAEPDANLNGKAINLAQGRVLGGGTAVNGMAYCRGAASLFNEWADLSGNRGLAWDSLLDDFKATAHYQYQPADYCQVTNRSAYGGGPLDVSQSSGLTGFDVPFATAVMEALGLPEVDLTDGTGIGMDYGLSSISAVERTRSYARNTFGAMMEYRPNVEVIHDAWAHHIGFQGSTAVNVTYLHMASNETRTVSASEIIVSGGAINTPKLLMLSGVGPQDRLQSLGVPVVADMPAIGQNLYDHAFAIFELQVTPDVKTFWQWSMNQTANAIATEAYARNRSGPLGWNNGYLYAAYRLPDAAWQEAGVDGSHYTSLPADRPHVLIEYSTVPFMAAAANFSAVTAWTSLVQPEDPGSVTLRSSNYREDPVIHTNYYGSAADKVAVQYSFKQLRQILHADQLKPLILDEFYPGANVTTDQEIWAAIQNQTYSFRHPVGTVALGKALDKDWRLKGLKGIRVVDSSTFPYPTTCHPQAVVYALAHRAARDIRVADRG
ncbi:hypothetical protein EYZ11_007078 [Aspergillus tanneri]|uniref:Glucose-methanol-choline oxidoreductase N-terminal domain-containing protein n=1 Tax=Aspergillus tanneri TaxID=1220188 RepID=A0A4S3JDW8_9EURO|nr:uncharacterized protein ATNIH1004_003970 [Aspergillus tanneri]KAA8648087.1 hypothetical protein ATNIH1004_003970 [Aspergillus tanneri]THC93459.1 hypothetical protein EYZ11_007078 [Aspergillus tanneri]